MRRRRFSVISFSARREVTISYPARGLHDLLRPGGIRLLAENKVRIAAATIVDDALEMVCRGAGIRLVKQPVSDSS